MRGIELIVEDSNNLGGKYRYQHIFKRKGYGIWSVLSNQKEPPYLEGYVKTLIQPIKREELEKMLA